MIQLTNRSGSGITELVAGGRFPALSTRPKAGAGRSPSPWRPAPLHQIARSALPGVGGSPASRLDNLRKDGADFFSFGVRRPSPPPNPERKPMIDPQAVAKLVAFSKQFVPFDRREEFADLVAAVSGGAAEDGLTPALRRRVREGIAKKASEVSGALDAKFPDISRIGQS